MATPRIFVSSTCYDLLEIRTNLRNFIQDFAYEPVMSEFGDIFYEFGSHIQDSALKEIEKAQMFILVIGNNYGSNYYKESEHKIIPDSVTLKEFKTAVGISIPKIMFINKYVNYDYKNYLRALSDYAGKYLNNDTSSDEKEDVDIRTKFDNSYHFPQPQYKKIFRFLDVIYSLKFNNAILEFETFDDIKGQLKKQWAGFLYEKLSAEKVIHDKESEENTLTIIKNKISTIDSIIRDMVANAKKDEKVQISLENVGESVAINDLKDARSLISSTLSNILNFYNYWNESVNERITFKEIIHLDKTIKWLNQLNDLVKRFKWSETISVRILFDSFEFNYSKNEEDVPIDEVSKLDALFRSLNSDEVENFASTVKEILNKNANEDNSEEEDFPF